MTGFDDDRELDDFLARRSALHRRLAERDQTEPPPELDRCVLDKAREAIDIPASAPLYRAPRWALPVSLAATVVLALAVVVNFERMQHGAYPVAASASRAANAAPAAAEAKSLKLAPPPPALSPEANVAAPGAEALVDEPPAAVAEVRPQRPASAVQMPPTVHAASDAAVAGVPASPRLEANGNGRLVHAPANEIRIIVPAKREMAVNTTALENDQASAERRARTELVSGSAVMANTAAARAPAPVAAAPSDKSKHADPQTWLREIERLRAAGRADDADRELAEFRKVFPGQPVPAAARDPRPAQ